MAVENQYNVIKVNELTALEVAQGADEIIINDIDSIPLETKKITAENFAYSIKDYILPIASADVLGGIKIGEGLTINPITGVLDNAVLILDDLGDVAVVNPVAGHVLRYNGVVWANEAEGGITNVIAGDGLSGGGFEGEITLHVNAGDGLSIKNDLVTFNAGSCLSISSDIVNVNLASGLTVSNNSIAVVPGVGLNIQNNAVNFVPGQGLIPQGPGIRTDIGRSIRFNGNKFEVEVGTNLYYDDGERVAAHDATYDVGGVSKFAPLVNHPEDLKGTPSYHNDQINPAFLDGISLVPTGAVFFFAMSTVPFGFLFCDGSTVDQAAYPKLWNAIGTTYNDGNEGDGKFRLPDLRDDFVRGANSLDGSGRYVGRREEQQTELTPHSHGLPEGEASLSQDELIINTTATGSVSTPGGLPTSQNNFVWGFGMNFCPPPSGGHRINDAGEFEETSFANSTHFYDQFIGEYIEGSSYMDGLDVDTAMVPIPPGCTRVTFPCDISVSSTISGGGSALDITWPTQTNTQGQVEETRPRNVALLPCIKW